MENVNVLYPEFWQGSLKRFELLKASSHLIVGCIYFCGDADTLEMNGLVQSEKGIINVAVSENKAVCFGNFGKETDLSEIKRQIKDLNKEVDLCNYRIYDLEEKKQDKPEQHTFTQIYSEEKKVQKLFSLSSGGSVILNVVGKIYGKIWTDTLYYSSVPYMQKGCFFTNYHTDFVECRRTAIVPNFVGIRSKNDERMPSLSVTLEVVYLDGTITWFNGELEEEKLATNCDMVAATINLGSATNLQTNSDMVIVNDAGEHITSLDDDILYTMNASASNGLFIIPNRSNYQNTQIYCFGDGTAELGDKSLDYKNGNIIVINGNDMKIMEDVRDYYTKEETDELLKEKGNDLNLENGQAEGSLKSKNANNSLNEYSRYSFAFGKFNTVLGSYSLSVGYGNYNDIDGYLLGYGLKISNPYEGSIGKYNKSSFGIKEDDATAFSIGNGSSDLNRGNAFEVKQSGLVIPGKSGSIAENDNNAVTGGIVWEALQNFKPSTEQVQADWNETDETKVSFIQGKPNLASVATSGSYNDLTGTPDLSNFVSCLNISQTIYGQKTFAGYAFRLADSYNSAVVPMSVSRTTWKQSDGTTKTNQPYLIVTGGICASSTMEIKKDADFLINGNDVFVYKNKFLEGKPTPAINSTLENNEIYTISFNETYYSLNLPEVTSRGYIKLYIYINTNQTLFVYKDSSYATVHKFTGTCSVEFYNNGNGWEIYSGSDLLGLMHLEGDEKCSGTKSFKGGGISILDQVYVSKDFEVGRLSVNCCDDFPVTSERYAIGQGIEIPTRGAVSNYVSGFIISNFTANEDGTEYTTPERKSVGAVIYKVTTTKVEKLILSELELGVVFGKTIISNYKNSVLSVPGVYNEILLGEYRPDPSDKYAVFPFDYQKADPDIKVEFAMRKSFQEVSLYMATENGNGYYTSSYAKNDKYSNADANVVYSSYLANTNTDTSYHNVLFWVKDENGVRKAKMEDVLFVRIKATRTDLSIAPLEQAEIVMLGEERNIAKVYGRGAYKAITNYSSQYGTKIYEI